MARLGRLTLGYTKGRRWLVWRGRQEYWWWTVGIGPFYALWHKTEAQVSRQYD